MILRTAVTVLALAIGAVNSGAAPGNPEGTQPADSVTVNQKNWSTKIEPRELSRKERKERLSKLADRYHDFLNEVEPIITSDEVDAFLLLETDAQRDYFIERFWLIRDSDPATPRNEYRDRYEELLVEAKERFKYLSSDPARAFLSKGAPAETLSVDCSRLLVPIQIWFYSYLEGFGHDVRLIFYEPRLGRGYRLWQPHPGMRSEALRELLSVEGEHELCGQQPLGRCQLEDDFFGQNARIQWECRNGDHLVGAIGWTFSRGDRLHTIFEPPEIDPEHVGRTLRNTVVANPDAPKIPAELAIEYPGRRGTRTAVRLSMAISRDALTPKELDGTSFYNLDVTGEILKDGAFFDNYRYRYNFPAEIVGETIPLVVDRFLRPNRYLSRIKVIDANSGAEAVLEREMDVPKIEVEDELTAEEGEAVGTLDTIRTENFLGESRLNIVPLPAGILTGYHEIETIVTGDAIDYVEFQVGGKTIMTKREPPFSLELDLGIVPASRSVRALGYSDDGKLIAGDEIFINTGADPFRVHISHPRIAPSVSGQTRVEVDVEVPEGKSLDRIDLYLNESLVGSMYEKPYAQTIFIPAGHDMGYIRAVARTSEEDPLETEDVVFINSPNFIQEVDVHLVELPTTVLRDGRPIQDLPRSAFRIFDGGTPVEIAKFEYVRDIPLYLGLAVDSSGSMEERMIQAQRAAAQFFRDLLRSGDRAFVVAFADVPLLVQKWTDDREALVQGLAALRAEDATALYDSIVYSLYNFQGVKGQKALVLLSDGKDTSSRFTFEQALEYAQRSAVPVYTIGLGIPTLDRATRGKLSRISAETGGRSYFIDEISGLDLIYAEIEIELRAQYLLGFYPAETVARGSDWREVQVMVEEAEARTIRGYYP